MLAALEACADLLERALYPPDDIDKAVETLADARAAIAKATGGDR